MWGVVSHLSGYGESAMIIPPPQTNMSAGGYITCSQCNRSHPRRGSFSNETVVCSCGRTLSLSGSEYQ